MNWHKKEIVSREKRVNSFELKIDSNCENYIALYNPVAVDLRLVLSLLKICSTLERIAGFADGIARYMIEESCEPFSAEIKEKLRIETMFDTVIEMLSDSYSGTLKFFWRIIAIPKKVVTLHFINPHKCFINKKLKL